MGAIRGQGYLLCRREEIELLCNSERENTEGCSPGDEYCNFSGQARATRMRE